MVQCVRCLRNKKQPKYRNLYHSILAFSLLQTKIYVPFHFLFHSISYLVKHKSKHYSKYLKSKSPDFYNKYKKCRNTVTYEKAKPSKNVSKNCLKMPSMLLIHGKLKLSYLEKRNRNLPYVTTNYWNWEQIKITLPQNIYNEINKHFVKIGKKLAAKSSNSGFHYSNHHFMFFGRRNGSSIVLQPVLKL